MSGRASDATRAGPGSLEMSFTFQPGNGRNNGCRHTDQDRNVEPGNIPRISRLTALVIRFEGLVRRGDVRDYADLARLGCVTRARIMQIMNLLHLAPDIQEALLFLPRTLRGRDPICKKDVRPIAAVPHWPRQRKMWATLVAPRTYHGHGETEGAAVNVNHLAFHL